MSDTCKHENKSYDSPYFSCEDCKQIIHATELVEYLEYERNNFKIAFERAALKLEHSEQEMKRVCAAWSELKEENKNLKKQLVAVTLIRTNGAQPA